MGSYWLALARRCVEESRCPRKQAGIGQYLADSPFLTTVLGGAATGGLAGAGFGALGKQSPNAADIGVGALGGSAVGALLSLLPAHFTSKMVKNRQYRRKFHKSPFLKGIGNRLLTDAPTSIPAGLLAAPMTLGLSIPAAAARSALGPAIGAAGRDGNSRTWDVFWNGGGARGALASYLDHAYNGPSENLDERDARYEAEP